MQIASGWCKGMKLATPEGLDTRPTRGRVRASAINMLQPWIDSAVVLDLFAGSGAVGLELMSRGARGGLFIEKAPAAVKVLQLNVKEFRARAQKQGILVEPLNAVARDVFKEVEALTSSSFDLIWADPPYKDVAQFLNGPSTHLPRLLKEEGVFALESGIDASNALELFSSTSGLSVIKQRTYGVSLITIWQKL